MAQFLRYCLMGPAGTAAQETFSAASTYRKSNLRGYTGTFTCRAAIGRSQSIAVPSSRNYTASTALAQLVFFMLLFHVR